MTPDVQLRALQAADLPQGLAWRNHPDIRRHMRTQHEISLPEHTRWFEAASGDASRRLLVVERAGAPMGYVQFSGVAPGEPCDWGFYAAPGAPRGTGTALGCAALKFAFDELRVHKVCGQALASNQPSIHFHLKLGFTQEGILRQQQCTGDTLHDLVCFGLLRQEWPSAACRATP